MVRFAPSTAALLGLCVLLGAGCGEKARTRELGGPRVADAGAVPVFDAGVPDVGSPVDAGVPPPPPPPVDAGVPDSGIQRDIEDRLREVPGLTIETQVRQGDVRLFVLRFEQPEDHAAGPFPRFEQRVVLRHRGVDRPTVLHTTGYDLFGAPLDWLNRESEPSALLSANELVVEHRFFGESRASRPDWSKMTVAQSAADTHAIFEALAPIYVEPWLGTGVSKGGMTAIFHHHHYPDDFAMIVPYVAPISFGIGDPRYLAFLDTNGPADGVCRRRVQALAAELIRRRAEVAAELRAQDRRLAAFSAEIVEAAVAQNGLTFEWGFWQYWGSREACSAVPGAGADVGALAQFGFVSAEQLMPTEELGLRPYSYQVAAELGSPAYSRRDLIELVRGIDWSVLPMQPPPPWGTDPRFDPEPMQRIDGWLRNQARDVVGVYGEWDPWTGGMPTVDDFNNNSVIFMVPETGHGAQLAMLPRDEKLDAFRRIELRIGFEPREGAGVLESPTIARHRRVVEALRGAERRFGAVMLRP